MEPACIGSGRNKENSQLRLECTLQKRPNSRPVGGITEHSLPSPRDEQGRSCVNRTSEWAWIEREIELGVECSVNIGGCSPLFRCRTEMYRCLHFLPSEGVKYVIPIMLDRVLLLKIFAHGYHLYDIAACDCGFASLDTCFYQSSTDHTCGSDGLVYLHAVAKTVTFFLNSLNQITHRCQPFLDPSKQPCHPRSLRQTYLQTQVRRGR